MNPTVLSSQSSIPHLSLSCDLHTIFSTFGKVAKVTILRDCATRQSRGIAFILFVSRNDVVKAVDGIKGKILNGRTLRASIAADNGRATEFIRKKVYKDKSRCYECGEEGNLLYECPKNQFGPRERKRGRRECSGTRRDVDEEEEGVSGGEGFEVDNWASMVMPKLSDHSGNLPVVCSATIESF